MPVIVPALALVSLVAPQEAKTFRDNDLGLAFQYPANWELKKGKYSTDLTFTAADGSSTVVQIFKTEFRQEKAVWQQLQREVADQMKRRVSRQWEEQILGVPLLLTQLDYNDGPIETTVLVGLLYTATKEKLNFRLSSSARMQQEANASWRQVLNSLRTTNGELPKPEDPTKPLPNPNKTDSGKPVTTLGPDDLKGDPVRTKNVARISALGQQLDVYLPEGWTLEAKEDTVALKTEKLIGSVTLSVVSGGRPQIPSVLAAMNQTSFLKFASVSLRDDPVPAMMKSGSYVVSTLRIGKDSDGKEEVSMNVVGTNGSLIWKIVYDVDTEANQKSDKKLMDRLTEYLAVEIAQ